MAARNREQMIGQWLARVERSPLSAPSFFAQHRVPFSLPQYYVYRRKLAECGLAGLHDQRHWGNHRRLNAEGERYLEGYLSAEPNSSLQTLRDEVSHRFDIDLSLGQQGQGEEGINRYARDWLPCGPRGQRYGGHIFLPCWPRRREKWGRPRKG